MRGGRLAWTPSDPEHTQRVHRPVKLPLNFETQSSVGFRRLATRISNESCRSSRVATCAFTDQSG